MSEKPKNWQMNCIWKGKEYCTYCDSEPSSVFAIMSMCGNRFGWKDDYKLVVQKQINGINNHLTYYSRIHPDGIDMLEVEAILLPEELRKEI